MLEFCPVCKKILEIGEWKGLQVGKCSCGFMRTAGIEIQKEEENASIKIGSGVSENLNEGGFSFSCKKCGHDKSEVKYLGEFLGNEKSVTLFTCLKCGNAERR